MKLSEQRKMVMGLILQAIYALENLDTKQINDKRVIIACLNEAVEKVDELEA